jgi:endonuclease YncB( thermonuclease family)
VTGTEWQIESVEKVTDGDTLRVIRSRIEHMGDHDFRITDVDSVPIRLVWVDTPSAVTTRGGRRRGPTYSDGSNTG